MRLEEGDGNSANCATSCGLRSIFEMDDPEIKKRISDSSSPEFNLSLTETRGLNFGNISDRSAFQEFCILLTFMKEIPDKILSLILLFTVRGHNDMRSLSLTCKRWRSFVQQDSSWKLLSIRGWGSRSDIVLLPIEKDASVPWFKFYRDRVLSHLPGRCYMKNQQHLTVRIRAILINWLLAVVDEFQQNGCGMRLPLAHHNAVSFFDAYCVRQSEVIRTSDLQTLGAACALLALHHDSSTEEIEYANFEKAAFYTNWACTGDEIMNAAHRIAEVLKLRVVGSPSDNGCEHIDRLLTAMHKNYPASSTHCLSHYLGELALQSEASLKYEAAMLASSAFALACHTLGWPEGVWMPVLRAHSAFTSLRPLQACMVELQGLLRQALAMLTRRGRRGDLPHVVVKYSRRKRQQVAMVIVTPLPWPAVCPHGQERGPAGAMDDSCEHCARESAAGAATAVVGVGEEEDHRAGETGMATIPPPEDTMDAGGLDGSKEGEAEEAGDAAAVWPG